MSRKNFFLLQIVWDPDKKKWTNVGGDDDGERRDLPPPPKNSELPAITKGLSAAGSEGHATRPSGSNVYRLSGSGKGKTYFNKSTVQDA
jgi:hypothetical protein